ILDSRGVEIRVSRRRICTKLQETDRPSPPERRSAVNAPDFLDRAGSRKGRAAAVLSPSAPISAHRRDLARFIFRSGFGTVLAVLVLSPVFPAVPGGTGDADFGSGNAGAVDLEGTPDALVARLRVLDGPATLERYEDESKDNASVNAPIYSGDAVTTGAAGRLEIQLGSGWLVRLDHDSRVVFESLPVQRASPDQPVLLQLTRGSVEIEGRAAATIPSGTFQIDAPGGSVHLLSNGRNRIDLSERGALVVSSYRGAADGIGANGSVTVQSGQRTVLEGNGPQPPHPFNTAAQDDFNDWIDQQNVKYVRARSEEAGSGGNGEAYEGEIPDSVEPYRRGVDGDGPWVTTADDGTA